ncbi:hypothetical protein D3C73_1627270 [compost metagenome]
MTLQQHFSSETAVGQVLETLSQIQQGMLFAEQLLRQRQAGPAHALQEAGAGNRIDLQQIRAERLLQ